VSINVVLIVGLVAVRPIWTHDSSSASLLVATVEGDGACRERHRVVVARSLADLAVSLGVGQQVFVSGTVQRDHKGRVMVVARELWPVGGAPGATQAEAAMGTHASPHAHQRVGHWRRVSIGGPRERLVWVRPTIVASLSGEIDSI
jgi:hypothetical protein